jgi:hypothetical protein
VNKFSTTKKGQKEPDLYVFYRFLEVREQAWVLIPEKKEHNSIQDKEL